MPPGGIYRAGQAIVPGWREYEDEKGACKSDYGVFGSILQLLRCAWEHIFTDGLIMVRLGAYYSYYGVL